MRVFIAGLSTETNTFSPWPTLQADYEEYGVWRGTASRAGNAPECLIARRLRELAEADGFELVEALFAAAEPGGPTLRDVYQGFRREILDELQTRGRFDIILLNLHGAMVAEGCDDCEGDLISGIRELAGANAVIGVEIDPHSHLTAQMVAQSDVIVAMKEYPHNDFLACAEQLYRLCVRAARGEIHPVPTVFDCRMVGFYPTTREPMSTVLSRMREAERAPGVLSVSFIHGFPWGDTAETGSKVLAYADGDGWRARAVATEVGLNIYGQRHALLPRLASIDEALERASQIDGCIVLADAADNPGGGAPGDNVSLLAAILERRLAHVALGCVWDPRITGVAAKAGVGATLEIELGGKWGDTSGFPLRARAYVKCVRQEHDQASLAGSRSRLGLSVWLDIHGVDVVVTSVRTQTFAPDAFTGLGIDLAAKRIVAVKSSQHFEAHFSSIASAIIVVGTPGALNMDFARLPYRKKRDLDYFPRAADPLSMG